MTGQGPAHPTDWEEQIDALLDGALDKAAAEALRAAAARDSALARAISEARQLQRNMDQLALEKAPYSLRQKLMRIPREHGTASSRPMVGLPRWVLAGGLVSVALIAVTLTMHEPAPPTAKSDPQAVSRSASHSARAEQTRRELAITFHYLDKIGLRLGRQIRTELQDELSAPIKENFSRHMPVTRQILKEKRV